MTGPLNQTLPVILLGDWADNWNKPVACSQIRPRLLLILSYQLIMMVISNFLVNMCDMAFIESMHRNKPNITFYLHPPHTYTPFHLFTHSGLDKRWDIVINFQQHLLNTHDKTLAYSFKFHLDLFLTVSLRMNEQWFRWWLGTCWTTSHYFSRW